MNPWLAKAKEVKSKMDVMLNTAEKEQRVFTDEEKTLYETMKKEVDENLAMAERVKDKEVIDTLLVQPVAAGNTPHIVFAKDEKAGPFNNFVEQLAAVKQFGTNGTINDKLNIVNTASGMNEGVSSEGGWAVQSDFAGLLMNTAVKDDPLLSMVDSYEVSAKSNAVEWVDIDEKDIEDNVFGGVKVYWAKEAGTVNKSKPTLKDRELKLEKLMGIAYATDELNSDSNFVNDLYTRAFSTAIRRELSRCVISGTGVGKPLGMLKSPALVKVAKESGQAADTIVWENISKMYHRAWMKQNMVWVIHPDSHEQLDFLEFPVGTGGVPVYLPATKEGSIDSMRGKRIIENDFCSKLGDFGDIMFVDPKEYILIYKGGVKKDVSIHVQFLQAEDCFRFIFRANGMPKRSSDLKIANSTKKRSPYIVVDNRA